MKSLFYFAGLFTLNFCPHAVAGELDAFIEQQLSVEKPAFVRYLDDQLIVTSFGSDVTDKVIIFEDFSSQYIDRIVPEQSIVFDDNVTWPNDPAHEVQTIDGISWLAIPGGFFSMPFPNAPDRSGALHLMALNAQPQQSLAITPVKKGWFYHKVVWRDMNNDGRLDIVSARSNFNPIRQVFNPILLPWWKVRGELMWFEQPEDLSEQSYWRAHKIVDGPEVFFEFVDLDDDGIDEIIASESFQKRLRVYWQNDRKWNSRVVADDLGVLFSTQLTDVNRDGRTDLIVTNHEADEKAGVFAFEIPDDFKRQDWIKHVLLDGIETRMPGQGQASPGGAIAITPQVDSDEKPVIVISGDGSQRVHLLIPNSSDINDWQYREEIILDAKTAVTGGFEIADLDADGWYEIIVPEYDNDLISILSFKRLPL